MASPDAPQTPVTNGEKIYIHRQHNVIPHIVIKTIHIRVWSTKVYVYVYSIPISYQSSTNVKVRYLIKIYKRHCTCAIWLAGADTIKAAAGLFVCLLVVTCLER